jgi:putative SOS response-associated peptidase YedK
MCNLYSLNKKRDMVARFFRASHDRAAAFKPTGAIFPRHIAPVVRCADDGEREIVTMSWGFMLLQNERAPRPVTNVRDDKILTSKFWRKSFAERRCLVPTTSFCEPYGDVKPATLALVFAQGHRAAAALRISGLLAALQGPDEEARAERRD